jgi:hypothetical protein
MDKERREMSTADLARAQAPDRAAVQESARTTVADAPSARVEHEERVTLFPENESTQFRTRWTDIQAAFVDAPRAAVERADALVADMLRRMAETFAGERANLEKQWDRGNDVTTEDLRIALQRYRAFFDRLLNV